MADPGFTVHVVNTRTGEIVLPDIPVIGTPQFLRQINDDGNITIEIPAGDTGCPPVEVLRQLVSAWRFSIAVCVGATILAYGPIITSKFDHASGNLTVGAGSMWAHFARRLMINESAVIGSPLSMDPSQDVNLGFRSLGSIARDMVYFAGQRGVEYLLPIDFGTFVSGTHERNYPVYDLAPVGQRLKDITQVEDGPDIDWDPYFYTSTNIRTQLRFGDPSLTQVGLDLIWDDSSSVTYINVDSDSSNLTTDVYTRGNQTERAMEVAHARDWTLVNAGFPVLEMIDSSHQSVTEFPTIQSHADEWIRFHSTPVEVWEAEVVMDMAPVVGTYKPGDSAQFNVQRHPWIPPGSYRQRLLGWSSAGPNRLKLILEALEGAA